ncbi:hypothetical protein [Virgibacillus pantothenticus]|nr:hypothetical protein [Virgibacillus pantothenticus]
MVTNRQLDLVAEIMNIYAEQQGLKKKFDELQTKLESLVKELEEVE